MASARAGPLVLLVEDDDIVAETLELYLEQAGFVVTRTRDGLEGLHRATTMSPALVILDLMIPKLSGQDVCARLRARSAVPILMLTARTAESDRIRGLELGADDYVGKPFSPREIVLRARNLLRRTASSSLEPAPIRVGELEVDAWRRSVRIGSTAVALTATEFKLLEAMAMHPGRTFTRDELVARALGPDYTGMDRTVDVHVTNIRRKLEAAGGRRHIETVHGLGYRLGTPAGE